MKLLRSFQYAFNGLLAATRSELNMKIHFLAVLVVSGAGFYFGICKWKWCAVLLCFALVISLEMVNTALEKLIDKLHPEQDPIIGQVKDMLAGAVLLAAIFAAAIGFIIFYPYLLHLVGH